VKYLPVLGELFTSDSVRLLIVGIVIAVAVGFFLKTRKSFVISIAVSIAVYAVCELVSNIRTNFLVEIILVCVGTAAIGCVIGFAVGLLIRVLRGRKNR
jgi:ribose/xylose/arabinose/galactoside ABC-type transport system permease subunit